MKIFFSIVIRVKIGTGYPNKADQENYNTNETSKFYHGMNINLLI